MASRPDEPPESIILGAFSGVRNTVAPERLGVGDLEAAVNVDLDDAGQARRRRGYALKLAGSWHSATTHLRGTLIVKDGTLGWLLPAYVFQPLLAGVGDQRIASKQVGSEIFFSSETASGVIMPDDTVQPWGENGGDGVWISPVINPTATLGAISGKSLKAPPMATEIELYNGRLYMAAGRILWATELYAYRLIDKTRTFIQFESDIVMVAAVDDGLYIGTLEGLWFLKGPRLDSLVRTQITNTPVVPGSAVFVPSGRVDPQARQGPVAEQLVVVFMTADGWCSGASGGQVLNLTRDRMVFPDSFSAAALYREQDGVTQVISAVDSRGTPTSSARIGDYCDAEIVRAADRRG